MAALSLPNTIMSPKRPRVPDKDRISDLADSVLCHILSFLPTKCSVRTRVLSTRWKHLFSYVPVLDFRYDRHAKIYPPDRFLSFLDFVTWVFNSYNVGHMDRFTFINNSLNDDNSRLYSWISNCVSRGIKELHLSVLFYKPQKLPCGIFTCKTLTYLSVTSGNFIFDVPKEVFLPHLKKLVLLSVSFIDGDSSRRFFRSCPVLENLFLDYSCALNTQFLDISIHSLKTLSISLLSIYKKFDLMLDLPNIEKFTYIASSMELQPLGEQGSYSFKGFKLLAEADVRYSYRRGSEGRYEPLDKLVKALYYARKLTYHESGLKSRKISDQWLPVFCNLTHLEIGSSSSRDSKFVLYLLNSMPRLEELVFDYGWDSDDESCGAIHFPSESVPPCVSLNLKEIRIEGYMSKNIPRLMQYLLENARVLGMLKIRSWGRWDWKKKSEMTRKLMTLLKWSKDCKIVF